LRDSDKSCNETITGEEKDVEVAGDRAEAAEVAEVSGDQDRAPTVEMKDS